MRVNAGVLVFFVFLFDIFLSVRIFATGVEALQNGFYDYDTDCAFVITNVSLGDGRNKIFFSRHSKWRFCTRFAAEPFALECRADQAECNNGEISITIADPKKFVLQSARELRSFQRIESLIAGGFGSSESCSESIGLNNAYIRAYNQAFYTCRDMGFQGEVIELTKESHCEAFSGSTCDTIYDCYGKVELSCAFVEE